MLDLTFKVMYFATILINRAVGTVPTNITLYITIVACLSKVFKRMNYYLTTILNSCHSSYMYILMAPRVKLPLRDLFQAAIDNLRLFWLAPYPMISEFKYMSVPSISRVFVFGVRYGPFTYIQK